jgi:hypothetical protein
MSVVELRRADSLPLALYQEYSARLRLGQSVSFLRLNELGDFTSYAHKRAIEAEKHLCISARNLGGNKYFFVSMVSHVDTRG